MSSEIVPAVPGPEPTSPKVRRRVAKARAQLQALDDRLRSPATGAPPGKKAKPLSRGA
jgi:hypothetical protein